MAAFDWPFLRRTLFPENVAPDARSPTLDRLAIVVLGVEWVVFGSMHFTAYDWTLKEVPGWVPWPDACVTVSGILEVLAGLFAFYPRTRRLASAMTFFLLIVLLPGMYQILVSDAVLPPKWPGFVLPLFRVLLLPNNVYLATLAAYLWRNPDAALFSTQAPTSPPATPRPDHRIRLLAAGLLLASNCAGFLALVGTPHFSGAALWAMTCIAFGALLGFLFAVPRVNVRAAANKNLSPNTNIETVSDWLTKTLIGVGLINLANIGAYVMTLSSSLHETLGVDKNFALALLIYFFVLGLIEGYLLTRTFLYEEFDAEQA
jgi:uncharacterized membrane protein